MMCPLHFNLAAMYKSIWSSLSFFVQDFGHAGQGARQFFAKPHPPLPAQNIDASIDQYIAADLIPIDFTVSEPTRHSVTIGASGTAVFNKTHKNIKITLSNA